MFNLYSIDFQHLLLIGKNLAGNIANMTKLFGWMKEFVKIGEQNI